ncbi:hypothetical protein [Actinoplanes regularis]|uniref:Peptidase metallopeptidase domain-containing protein n=1 Tax=Actinoplanes regularis TaxID=52697 RepID=A0A239C4R8_9ACTN|nr:hypothetical protein [Actinoplanes regularis]GIE88122.1 hypothetical protein Are01nite_46020 [Actinoplanes regularis]SNS14919.1 hypothetical protein SAMN06264365_110294 [Actinoplanes regularis]
MTFRCIDRVPGDDLQDLLDRGNGRLEAAGDPEYFWPNGATLRVRFLDGLPGLHRQVMAAATEWTDRANLTLVPVEEGPAEIRVTFDEPGNWSALGTMALFTEMFPADGPTLCLGEAPVTTPGRVALLARHEFGHALGLVHEHSSPAAGIRWNKPVVYRELGGAPNFWSPGTVDDNVFARYAADRTQFTEFDPKSVMLYPVPARWTLDGFGTVENTALSATDLEFVAATYPGR